MWEIRERLPNKAQKLNRSTDDEFITSAHILQNPLLSAVFSVVSQIFKQLKYK